MRSILFFVCLAAADATKVQDNTISEVVSLLQEMLDKSKADGKNDRELYAKFKCFCDTTTDEKTKAIADAQEQIETLNALLADLRGQNEKLSMEVAHLQQSMDENEAAREEATELREKEKEDFEKTKADLETGIDQLGRAVDLLAAVGADQTESVGADHEQFMAAGATEAAKAGFMTKGTKISKLSGDMKAALRAASVFLTGQQRNQVTAFVQAPFTGNYNAQSGEIVGVLKNMLDTFKSNLESAIAAEEKAQKEYDDLMAVKEAEFDEMKKAHESKKKTIGDNAETISTKDSELATVTDELGTDQEFLGSLTTRCAEKKKEFEHRTMLRANEEAAIAQAISILNSDEAFATFDKAGVQSFVQLKQDKEKAVRGKVLQELLSAGRKTHSMKLARIASALAAFNPFAKVLEMIRNTITLIEEEEKTDVQKKDWCRTPEQTGEQDVNEQNQADKETDMSTLEGNIGQLQISIDDTKENIRLATEDLNTNRETQTTTTTTRKDENALFHEELKNCQDVQAILAKAIEVLTKYYEFLHSHNAEKTYAEHAGKDSGGSNLERLAGKSVDELKEACNAKPECKGFNSAGWLKSAIAPEEEWYAWDEGSLFVKELPPMLLQTKQPVEGEPDAEFSTGQGESGNQAIEMLKFIESASKDEESDAIDAEKTAQGKFEGEMTALTTAEGELKEAISSYELDLANTEKQHEQAVEDLATTTKDRDAIIAYLKSIEPGCTFIQTNYETRKQNREAEIEAMKKAIELLEGTPAFQAATAAAEREALGKCGEDGQPCAPDGPGRGHAECEACLEGVTVYGYCTQNPDAGGCADATKTTSADALSLAHRK